MSEGPDPTETGKKPREHVEAHHQQIGEADGDGKPGDRHARVVQVCEAVLLALVTITAAWAGYSAARWGTESRFDLARASVLGTSPPATSSPPSRCATSTPLPSTRG